MLSSTGVREGLRSWLARGPAPVPANQATAAGLVDGALGQGVAGLLDEAVRDDARWPASVRALLHEARRALLRRGVWQLELAEDVRARLVARGIRALPMKGVALSERLYASPGERAMADVDLLVLDDWAAATRLLTELEFEPGEYADHAWSWRDPRTHLALELHRAVVSCPRLHPLDREGLWQRRAPGEGQVRERPADEDLLVQLALHAAFQHGLVLSLAQWLDLRRLIERVVLDPTRVAHLARAAHAQAAVGATLLSVSAVLEVPLPASWRAAGLLDLPPALARWLEARLARPLEFVTPSRPSLARLRFGLSAGRRGLLLRDTLWPRTHGDGPRTRALLARLARLARRAF